MVDIDIPDIIILIILSISLTGIVSSLFMLHRNYQVFNERMNVISKIFEKDGDDNYIWSSEEVFRLMAEAESIATHTQMIHQFWKKPTSFYKEFLENLEKKKAKRLLI